MAAGRPAVSDDAQSNAQEAAAKCCTDKDPMLAATAAQSLGHAGNQRASKPPDAS